MGAFETRLALQLLDRFPHLHLDTTMAMSPASLAYTGIDPAVVRDGDLVRYADRILFGSDFPNLPYPYEAERTGLWARTCRWTSTGGSSTRTRAPSSG